jgi:hypothetical protein
MTEIRLKHRLRRALVPGHGEKWDLHLLDISGAVSEKLGGLQLSQSRYRVCRSGLSQLVNLKHRNEISPWYSLSLCES